MVTYFLLLMPKAKAKTQPPILRVERLTKRYKELTAVNAIDFVVHPGEIVGLLGPNGAGKTTTIQMLLGLLEPTSGTIHVGEHNLAAARYTALADMNFASTYALLPGNLTVRENLIFFGMLYNVPQLKARINELAELFDLTKFFKTKSGALSSGEQTRLNLAKAFLNRPKLLLLDEPTASMDPDAAARMRDVILQEAKDSNAGIVWTSHNMGEVETVCDRLVFLSHGNIIAQGTPAELVARFGHPNLEETFIQLAREPLDS
jgi:ABC-2 type transport system ATP-binding protein